MKKTKWLIERYEDTSFINNLIEEVSKQCPDFKVVDKYCGNDIDLSFFSPDDCVVFYGTIFLGNFLKRYSTWIPGVIYNNINFECLTYYSHFGKYLLNQDYLMIPLSELYRRKEEIYNKFSIDNNVFIRPNSGNKTFCGGIYPYNSLSSEFGNIKELGSLPIDRILVIVSSPKLIEKEWRVVVVDRNIVSYSLYKKYNEVIEEKCCEDGAIRLVNNIIKEKWQPDKAYSIDICLSNGEYKLLEINSFSHSGFYACDAKRIVKEVSDCAYQEWEEYQNI